MTLYQAYCAGWQACLDGVDGRYWFTKPKQIQRDPANGLAWQLGWQDCFDNEEDGAEPIPENQFDPKHLHLT